MLDQATKLRSLVGNKDLKDNKKDNRAEILCISSGKGGVGKSNLTLNLAIAISNLGKSVCVIDADIGLGNIEIIAGVDSTYTLSDVISGKKTIKDIIKTISPNVGLVSGGSGIESITALSKEENISTALNEIQKLQDEYDYLLIDTGAGIGPNVMNFVNISDSLIVISTPDPTSVMDAYVLIKTAAGSKFKGKIFYVSNMVKNKKEGDFVYEKISNSASSFLSIKIDFLGYIPKSEIVVECIRNRVPFIIERKDSRAAKKVFEMADYLVLNEKKEKKTSLSERLLSIFFNRGE